MKFEELSIIFSVIIPAFNKEAYIGTCLDSLKRQSLAKGNFEVIVIDDCSEDKTVQTSLQYTADLNIRIIQREQNGGPGIARNDGLSQARGKYILFLDGDDFLLEKTLECLSAVFEAGDHDLITFNWTYFSDLSAGECTVPRRRDLEKMPLVRNLLVQHYLGMNMDGSVIYTAAKKTIFDQYVIQFPSGYHEDMSVIFQMYYAADSIFKLDEVLYVKNNREGSIVNTLSGNHVTGYFDAWPHIFEFLRKHEVQVDQYLPFYLRGMSGHVYTMVNKIYKKYSNDFDRRSEFYSKIIDALENDKNLKKPFADYFPSETKKDKFSQIFFKNIYDDSLAWSERVKGFESICFANY